VQADVNAKGVVVQGKLEGNIWANDRAELQKSAVIIGDIVTQRIAIEEGAYFKGKVDIQKEAAKSSSPPSRTEHQGEGKSASAPAASGAAAASGAVPSGPGGSGSAGPNTPVTKR
jgi:cytoskeletal protein CcmA (bactofilin family)